MSARARHLAQRRALPHLPDTASRPWTDRFLRPDRVFFPTHVGLVLEEVRAGYARLRLPVRPEVAQAAGIVHGGALATLHRHRRGARRGHRLPPPAGNADRSRSRSTTSASIRRPGRHRRSLGGTGGRSMDLRPCRGPGGGRTPRWLRSPRSSSGYAAEARRADRTRRRTALRRGSRPDGGKVASGQLGHQDAGGGEGRRCPRAPPPSRTVTRAVGGGCGQHARLPGSTRRTRGTQEAGGELQLLGHPADGEAPPRGTSASTTVVRRAVAGARGWGSVGQVVGSPSTG